MSDDHRQNDEPKGDDPGDDPGDDDRTASTPFENPYFLPAVFWAWAAWFGYDIATNAQAYQDNPKFNEYGLVITGVLALYLTWSAIRKKRAKRKGSSD